MIFRGDWLSRLSFLLERYPVVALLGARQVGKSALSAALAGDGTHPVSRFDLEDPGDLAKLTNPMLALAPLRGLVILDEVQRHPPLFPVLRVLADRPAHPAVFLILGSVAPSLIRKASESLAGRIATIELLPFDIVETGPRNWSSLWLRGGLPRSFLATTDPDSLKWRREYLSSYAERDLPEMGFSLAPGAMRRFLSMVAHYHGQIWNASEVGRSFGASNKTTQHDLDLLCGSFLAWQLPPWYENLGKRLVKSPKVYLRDSGLLHVLLNIHTQDDLMGHPKSGASFEGLALTQAIQRLGAAREECYFWATHQGAELDLLVVRGRRRVGVEVKLSERPVVTRSMRQAIADLRLDRLYVIHAGADSFRLDEIIDAVSIGRLIEDIRPLDENLVMERRDGS